MWSVNSDAAHQGRHPLAHEWLKCSAPAPALWGVAAVISIAAYTLMPEVVPQHSSFGESVDTWTTRGHFLIFSLGITLFFVVMMLAGGLVVGMDPAGMKFRDRDVARYWSAAENWPVMRRRMWSVMAWCGGLMAVAVSIGVNLYALSPSWGLPVWVSLVGIFALVGLVMWWLVATLNAMKRLPDDHSAVTSRTR